jgi:type IV pilus assembly protein PilY1
MRKTLLSLAAGALFAGSLPAVAGQDVDIFGGKGGNATDPNVLIVLDSSSNWSSTLAPNNCNTGNMADNTKFAAEVCALRTVLPLLPERMRIGIMMFAETGTNGGYVRFGIRNLTGAVSPPSGNKGALFEMLGNWVPNGSGTDNSGSNQPYAKTMFEAFKYFGGGGTSKSPQGANGYGPIAFAGGNSNPVGSKRRDYNGNNSGATNQATGNRAAEKYGADSNNALSSAGTNTYNNPITSDCAKNFIIFIGNGNPGTGGDSGTPDAATLFTNIGGNPSDRIKSAGTEVHASLMDEFARHLFKNDANDRAGDQFIRTYTIAVYQPQSVSPLGVETISNTDQQMIKLLRSAASAGGGKYFAATKPDDIVKALLTILNEVQAVNSVFVSASLPVSVNTQGTFLNQVYMGLFRPDPTGSPRWLGNLKEFKFIKDSSGDIYLADQNNNRAVNPATGFITPTSASFWTVASTYWANDPKGIPPTTTDLPDGDVVEKGGTAQAQRNAILTTQTQRKLYTCQGACANNTALSYEFTSANILGPAMQTTFGVGSAPELTLLIDWIRGQDNAGGATLSPLNTGQAPCNPSVAPCTWVSGELGPGWPTTVRPSLQGDVLHSQPVVLNYVSEGPIVFYGSNDGFLRAVKGGQGGSTDGQELWAFIPPEFYSKFKRLRYQDPTWLNPGTDPALVPFAATKDYFFDGPIGVWEDSTTTPATKWIFVTARRGGRLIYAFDVSNPAQPVFKWMKTQLDLPLLGQTWSAPTAFKIQGAGPFLMFGAGYDPIEDTIIPPAVPPTTGPGRGIYVLDANDGTPLNGGIVNTGLISTYLDGGSTATIANPIASDMAFLANFPTAGPASIYRAYVGDLYGKVYRLDMPDPSPTTWKMHLFAKLGDGLKFLYAPDLVKGGDRDYVLVGSGDREKPLVLTSQDYFFGLLDFQNAQPAAATSLAPVLFGSLTSLTGDGGMVSGPGWYRRLAPGEKVVNSPLTVAGSTFFATNEPTPTSDTSCETNLGIARAYGVSFFDGGKPASRESISTVLTGGGLAPSPKAGIVELEPGGEKVPFVIGSGKDGSRLEPERPPLNVPSTRTKVYWNVKSDS